MKTRDFEPRINFAVINGIKIPQSELKVLDALSNLQEAIAPAIARYAEESISHAAIYELLKRLEKKGIVSRREEHFELGGQTTKRVFYKINDGFNLKST